MGSTTTNMEKVNAGWSACRRILDEARVRNCTTKQAGKKGGIHRVCAEGVPNPNEVAAAEGHAPWAEGKEAVHGLGVFFAGDWGRSNKSSANSNKEGKQEVQERTMCKIWPAERMPVPLARLTMVGAVDCPSLANRRFALWLRGQHKEVL